jgi:hypothetical protein
LLVFPRSKKGSVMAKLGVSEAIESSIGEAPVCWGIGQSVESRYSQSGRPNAVAGLILGRQAQRHSLPNAVKLPRLFVIAITPTNVYFFDPPMREPRQPIVSASRTSLRTDAKRGWFWTRLVLEDEAEQRSMIVFLSRMAKGRKQILSTLQPGQG